MREGRSSRRAVLRVLGSLGLAGVAGRAAGRTQTGESVLEEWLSDTDNYDGTIRDMRNLEGINVLVGTGGNGGSFAFTPPAIRISPGTTVTWVWTGDGGQHSVVAETGADFDSGLRAEQRTEFSQQFELGAGFGQQRDQRVITYHCEPHRSLGMKGGIIVDGDPVVTEQPRTTDPRATTQGGTADGTEEAGDTGVEGAANWPQYQYGPANTGTVPDATLPVPGARDAWRFETRSRVEAPPVAVDGTVYAVDQLGTVYAVDTDDGAERWRHRVRGGASRSSLTVVDGTVYGGVLGQVFALEAATGEERWTVETGNQPAAAPAVVDGTAYVGTGSPVVTAFDTGDGTQQWQAPLGDTVRSSPTVVDGTVYVGSDDESVYALAASDGTRRWRAPTTDGVASSPAVTDDTVYVTGLAGVVYAFDREDGSRQWAVQLDGGPTRSSPAVGGDTVYVGDGEDLYALSTDDGSERWRFPAGREPLSPVVSEDTVYTASWDGVVYGLAADDGTERWRFYAGARPFLAGGRDHLHVGSDGFGAFGGYNGWLVALEPSPGRSVGAMGIRVPGTDLHLRERNAGIGAGAILTTAAVGTKVVNGIRRRIGGGSAGDSSADPDADPEASPEFDPTLLEISGVDEAAARRLATAGYGTLFEVAAASQHDLAAVEGISEALAARIVADLGGEDDDTATAAGADDGTGEATDTTQSASDGDAEKDGVAAGDTDPEQDGAAETDAGATTPFDSTATPAGAFAANCDAFEGASVVATEGAVHVYDGRFVDSVGEADARVYALAPPHADDERAETAFNDAARAWQGISKNTHVATVYDSGDDPRPWVAFDRGAGLVETHLEALDRNERIEVVLGLTEAIRTAGMYNVRHGDLTPAVVFLTDGDSRQTATLADWGLQRTVHEAVAGQLPPTPYTAPEQLDGADHGTDTDVYRLGAVAYRVLTGEHPFADAPDLETAIRGGEVTPPTAHDPSLPAAVDEIVADAMHLDADRRVDSPYEIHQRLAALD